MKGALVCTLGVLALQLHLNLGQTSSSNGMSTILESQSIQFLEGIRGYLFSDPMAELSDTIPGASYSTVDKRPTVNDPGELMATELNQPFDKLLDDLKNHDEPWWRIYRNGDQDEYDHYIGRTEKEIQDDNDHSKFFHPLGDIAAPKEELAPLLMARYAHEDKNYLREAFLDDMVLNDDIVAINKFAAEFWPAVKHFVVATIYCQILPSKLSEYFITPLGIQYTQRNKPPYKYYPVKPDTYQENIKALEIYTYPLNRDAPNPDSMEEYGIKLKRRNSHDYFTLALRQALFNFRTELLLINRDAHLIKFDDLARPVMVNNPTLRFPQALKVGNMALVNELRKTLLSKLGEYSVAHQLYQDRDVQTRHLQFIEMNFGRSAYADLMHSAFRNPEYSDEKKLEWVQDHLVDYPGYRLFMFTLTKYREILAKTFDYSVVIALAALGHAVELKEYLEMHRLDVDDGYYAIPYVALIVADRFSQEGVYQVIKDKYNQGRESWCLIKSMGNYLGWKPTTEWFTELTKGCPGEQKSGMFKNDYPVSIDNDNNLVFLTYEWQI
ncbi:hypothetical protein IWQ60_005054 [Tieghemiomyces parasiticus]|uniref:Uncharacterized protein n=1 Tax=Tieghemiomyces parasiticus TaxID=78921 RepID=A0A9W8DYT0_9FUNG|nr:hypothetical protein IWQ60_005054 [Tieghemiomyces parasiticus]